MSTTQQQLRALIAQRRGVIVPGAFNAMSARLVADMGFEAIYVTGAGVTNMWFGLPDQGFMGLHEIAEHTARIRDAVEVPLMLKHGVMIMKQGKHRSKHIVMSGAMNERD